MRTTTFTAALLAAAAMACIAEPGAGDSFDDENADTVEPTDWGVLDYSQSTTGVQSGGDVMTGPTYLYLIFYGSWTQAQKDLYLDLANNLSGSPLANVLTTYYGPGNAHATANFYVGSAVDPNRSQGTSIAAANVSKVIEYAITSGGLPRRSNAVYVFLPDTVTGVFRADGVDVCKTDGTSPGDSGYHNHYTDASGNVIKFAWIKNVVQCNGPIKPGTVTPNNEPIVDFAAKFLWHEYVEAISNPAKHGWLARTTKSDGSVHTPEIGDLCETAHQIEDYHPPLVAVPDDVYLADNGASATVHLGTRDWNLPDFWINADRGGCTRRVALARPVAHAGVGPTNVSGDLDGNGIGDLLWRNSSTGALTAWLLDANDVAQQKALVGGNTRLSEELQVIAVADFDGDHHADLLWRDLIDGSLVIWNLSGATVTGTQLLALGNLPSSVVVKAVGDFDGDGKADLVFEDYANDSVARYWLGGSGAIDWTSLPSFTPFYYSTNVETVGTGDFDGDGKAEILWYDDVYGQYIFWGWNGHGFSWKLLTLDGTLGVSRVLGIVDVDRDGVADVVGTSVDGTQIVWSTIQSGHVVTTPILGVPAPEWRFSGGTVLASGDRTGLLWRNRKTGDVSRWVLDPSGHFSSAAHIVTGMSQREELVTY